MPKATLTSSLVTETHCPDGVKKIDLFDTNTKGLVLEVRTSGGKTFYLRYQDQRGRTRQLRLADARDVTLAQARTLANKARGNMAMGNDPCDTKKAIRSVPTFEVFIRERYIPFTMAYKKSWACDESNLRNHLIPAFGSKHLDEITKHDVIAFHHGMRTKGYAFGTCNRCLILLRYALNLAIRWEIPGVKENPTKDVPLYHSYNHKERYLSQDEAKRLFESVRRSDNPMLQFIIPMLILTGARKREVLDCRWEDLDFNQMQWRVPVTKAGRPRHIPLSGGVINLLKSVPQDPNNPWLFPNPKTGKPFVNIFNSWDTARKDAKLEDVRLHDLRHSFASFLVNAGRSLYQVQKILGHTQVKTTQRYAHLAQETLLDATNAVAGVLSDAMPVIKPAPSIPARL